MANKFAIISLAVVLCIAGVKAGTPLVGYGSNTFNEIFSTGFQNGLGGYGAGTVAGAIGYYGQFTGIGNVGVGQTLSAHGNGAAGGGGYGGGGHGGGGGGGYGGGGGGCPGC